MSRPLEHDYIGLAENPPMEISDKFSSSSSSLNLKETELRLGLPGCESPERKSATGVSLFGKDLQKNKGNLKNLVAGSKRGFCEAINDGCCGKWVFSVSDNAPQVDLGKGACFFSPIVGLEGQNNNTHNTSQSAKAIHDNKPEVAATKAEVVGWPPIRSFRRNTMACNLTKTNEEEAEGKAGSCSCLYVKVIMDGAPYLRKIDLKNCTNYMQLSSALEKMFTCFTIGQCCSGGVPGKDGLSESSLRDLLHGSEYVLTYEDKDGDWMLVGDVPWEMFIESCRKLRIMKGSEATGLAMEKSRSQN